MKSFPRRDGQERVSLIARPERAFLYSFPNSSKKFAHSPAGGTPSIPPHKYRKQDLCVVRCPSAARVAADLRSAEVFVVRVGKHSKTRSRFLEKRS